MWPSVFIIFIFIASTHLIIMRITNSRESSFWKYHLTYYIFHFVCLFVAALCCPFAMLRPRDVRNSTIIVGIGRMILNKFVDIKWEVRNRQIVAEDRGAVIVCNHQATFDILGMSNIWDSVGKMAVVAKKELFYVFPFGLTAYLSGVVFIDRSNPKSAYQNLRTTTQIINKQKTKVWIFPEGTRNKDFTKLLPFKKGAFNIAVAAQVPIIPIVFSPYYFIDAEKHIFSKGHMIIQILDPIPTVGLTSEDVPELTDKVYEKMSAVYKELKKEVFAAE